MPAEGRERVAPAAFAIVGAANMERAAAMIGVTRHASDRRRRRGFPRVGASEQHVRGVGEPVATRRIVAPLAAQIRHAPAYVVTLLAPHFDVRVVGGKRSRRGELYLPRQIQKRQHDGDNDGGDEGEAEEWTAAARLHVALRAIRRAGRDLTRHGF
jgi:hypothetical protein